MASKRGIDAYVKEDYALKNTGEYICNDEVKKIRTVNREKVETETRGRCGKPMAGFGVLSSHSAY